ncbi:sensor histidine kinase [Sinimarinibacterium flocculans]|uniref:sensor histidine kinase n=1 Tax=Sinimarinibacterium flocculans TaxID=985250 RepID=UPI0024922D80|nr:ATP-binding protein [Sinimarinibacterium flocculans]
MKAADTTPVSEHARAEDWRVLTVLGPYRLLLVAILLTLFRSGYGPDFLLLLQPLTFFYGCLAYAISALVLLLLGVYRAPGLRAQAHLHLLVDSAAIGLLVYGAGGVASGLGILLLPPVVGGSLVIRPRLAAVHAAAATLTMFAAEFGYQLQARTWDASEYSQAGLLGLMFFVSGLVANLVAQRARRSEAMAARVGSEYLNLSRLSENIIESMHTGVCVVDGDDRVRVVNAAARRLIGDALQPSRPIAEAAPALAGALRAWRSGHSAAEPLHAEATGREVTSRFTRLGWGGTAPTLVMLDDAAQLREQAQQIKFAALGRLSAGIAHEIRNPLSAITQAGQLLAEAPEIQGENQRLLAMIQRHAGRIDRIVRDVLDLSRRDRGSRRSIRLRDWLLRTAALYHESHPHQPRPIEMGDVGTHLHVHFDPEHLRQILFNLWDNSFEHGAAGGRSVSVLMQAGIDGADGAVELDIIDDGAGIDAAQHDRIFEPFFTTHAGGTGLGLFLCRELCEYNQARLSHVPGAAGATFRIRFGAPADRRGAARHAEEPA